jgi:amidase
VGGVHAPSALSRVVRRSAAAAAALALLLVAGPVGADPTARDAAPPRLVELTVAELHAALAEGRTTCEAVVRGHLERIAAYDRQGPALQSVIATNPAALEEARALDRGPRRGPLHCVPVLVKDNVDVAGLATTGGATALAATRPPADAAVVAGLRRAGAVVLGKANLDEFAFGFTGTSSVGGQVRNAYDPARGPGGSSSGSAAATAASLAVLAVGSDTGGSIRVPSAVHGLVGIRPSLRLLSGDGVLPLARFQDTVGPMCRTVADCAVALDAMAGFDPSPASGQHTQPLRRDDEAVRVADAAEYAAVTGVTSPTQHADALEGATLRGARIGAVRALFGTNPDVLAAMDAAIAAMRDAGAVVEDVTIPDLSAITGYASVSASEFRDHLTDYLASWPSAGDAHPRSFEEVLVTLGYQRERLPTMGLYGGQGHVREVDPEYEDNTRGRRAFVPPRVLAALDGRALDGTRLAAPYDALLYPSVQSPAQVGGPPSTGSNNRLSPFTGFPAVTLPAAWTAATPARPALPIGMELLGREFDEERLLRLAAAYEQHVAGTPLARRAPTTTPELPCHVAAAPCGVTLPAGPPAQPVWAHLPGVPLPAEN